MDIKKKIICVVGPTASGKTGMGVALAKKLNGEIVSADSRQIYRGLDIGTGKDLDEYGNTKYHLIDICEPCESFTMFDWLSRAREVLDDIWERVKVPIVVGGTGLYVEALIEGFGIEKTEELKNLRTKEQIDRGKLETMSKDKLQEILRGLDEEAFLNVDLNNPVRVIRAIEKAQSGEKVTKNQPDFDYILIGRDLSRDELYRRIDIRVDERFGIGMLEEVEGLIDKGVDKKWLLSLGLEYRIIGDYLINHKISHEEMVQDLKWKSHQYARRQLTWWRRFDVAWVKSSREAEKLAGEFLGG